MAKIFITRHLEINSPLLEYAFTSGHVVVGRSLIKISQVTFNEFPPTDWVFFYSKNGVKNFLNQLDSTQKENLRHCKIGVIGNKTESAVMNYLDQKCDFVGNADQSNTDEFVVKLGHDKCLFPRASCSRKSIEKLLPFGQVEVLVVYENKIDELAFVEANSDVLVFTSPMNVDAYLLHSSIELLQKIVSIGHATQNYLDSLGFKNQKAYDPSEEGIVSLLKVILS